MSYGIRKDFYHSKAWKQVRRNVWLRQHCLCAICRKPVYVSGLTDYLPKESRRIGIVHHKIFLNDSNVYDKNITLNENNLEGVCKECHENIHHPNVSLRNEYEFDDAGNLVIKK